MIGTSKYFRTIVRHFFFWSLAILLWTLIRMVGVDHQSEMDLLKYARFLLVSSVFAGFIFGSVEFAMDHFFYKRISFSKIVVLRATMFLLATMLITLLSIWNLKRIMEINMSQEGLTDSRLYSAQMIVLIFYCFLVGFLIDFIREIEKRFGPGNLRKMLSGKYYSPKEEHRIFMFLDLHNSTGIAEKLGHYKYSQLIQDCFQDISILVSEFKASIYQYVGDEIVLTWTTKEGIKHDNCIKLYFAYRNNLNRKKKYFEQNFGLFPQFKAGLEAGAVMVAEVGDVKREIAYHGDVLNTASSIQKCCNQFNKDLLISENLKAFLSESLRENTHMIGDIQLKGKQDTARLYFINQPSKL
ncbi:MAG: adenylate/guanylate cyclase domain-containing protein [Marinoscillum sp.]